MSATVAICVGSDCRKRDEHPALRKAVGAVTEVIEVRCLGLCHSPVAVLIARDGDRHVVIERIRTDKQRRDLVAAVTATKPALTPRLRRTVVDGKQRRKALSRLARYR